MMDLYAEEQVVKMIQKRKVRENREHGENFDASAPTHAYPETLLR